MTNRFFVLLEKHQKLDDALRAAELSPRRNLLEILRLKFLKAVIKDRMANLLHSPAMATVH